MPRHMFGRTAPGTASTIEEMSVQNISKAKHDMTAGAGQHETETTVR